MRVRDLWGMLHEKENLQTDFILHISGDFDSDGATVEKESRTDNGSEQSDHSS